MNRVKFNPIGALILATAMLLTVGSNSWADSNLNGIDLEQSDRTIKGESGGLKDSQGCGFITQKPVYEMDLPKRIDYMRFTVEADGGQPTLLVVGPKAEDSFCVLGDEVLGLKPEISGVWEAGYYQIYVGDRTKGKHQFNLEISTSN